MFTSAIMDANNRKQLGGFNHSFILEDFSRNKSLCRNCLFYFWSVLLDKVKTQTDPLNGVKWFKASGMKQNNNLAHLYDTDAARTSMSLV